MRQLQRPVAIGDELIGDAGQRQRGLTRKRARSSSPSGARASSSALPWLRTGPRTTRASTAQFAERAPPARRGQPSRQATRSARQPSRRRFSPTAGSGGQPTRGRRRSQPARSFSACSVLILSAASSASTQAASGGLDLGERVRPLLRCSCHPVAPSSFEACRPGGLTLIGTGGPVDPAAALDCHEEGPPLVTRSEVSPRSDHKGGPPSMLHEWSSLGVDRLLAAADRVLEGGGPSGGGG
jgi:hypothetical protein